MRRSSRRDVLKGTGVGAGVVLGTSSASALRPSVSGGETADGSTVLTTFESIAGEGFITINGDDAEDDKISFSGDDIDGDVQINGEIYADGTWRSTLVDFPELDAEELVDELDDLPDDVEADITITVPPIEGVYLPAAGLMTAPLTLGLEVSASIFGETLIDVDVAPTAHLTTDSAGGIEGGLVGTGTADVEATIVANDFVVPETGSSLADDELDLPAPEGTNWLKLELLMEVEDPGALEDLGDDVLDADPVVGRVPPRDLDGDGLYESIRGTGAPTIFDVQSFFANLDHPTVQAHPEAFNFSETDNAEVTVADVQAYFNRVRRQ